MKEVTARGQILTEQPTSTQLKGERKSQRLLILRHLIMRGQDMDILKLEIIDTTTEQITTRDQKNLFPDPRNQVEEEAGCEVEAEDAKDQVEEELKTITLAILKITEVGNPLNQPSGIFSPTNFQQ